MLIRLHVNVSVYFSGIERIWESAVRIVVYGLQENEYVITTEIPLLFVEKKDDLIRLDIDYWMLCEMVIKDEYLTLRGDDLLD